MERLRPIRKIKEIPVKTRHRLIAGAVALTLGPAAYIGASAITHDILGHPASAEAQTNPSPHHKKHDGTHHHHKDKNKKIHNNSTEPGDNKPPKIKKPKGTHHHKNKKNQNHHEIPPIDQQPNVLIVGDSYADGEYQANIIGMFAAKGIDCHVDFADGRFLSHGGPNNPSFMSTLETDKSLYEQADVVVIVDGANDMYIDPEHRPANATVFKADYSEFIDGIRNISPDSSIVLSTIATSYDAPDYSSGNQVIESLVDPKKKIYLFDMFEVIYPGADATKIPVGLTSPLNSDSGLHTNREGYVAINGEMVPYVINLPS